MTHLELLAKAGIVVWPVLVAFALLASLFLPDQIRRRHPAAATVGCKLAWALAFFGALILSLLLSVPYGGDVSKVTLAPFVAAFADIAPLLTSALAIAGLVAYGCAGLAWAIAYFWLYARRLGLKYVMERDLWLRSHSLESLAGLTPELRKDFNEKVLDKVRSTMLYDGGFPLRPLQQKRFFGANLMLWPVTLLCYLLGDLALDVARHVWFAFRNWIHRHWEQGMAEYLADGELCRSVLAAREAAAGVASK